MKKLVYLSILLVLVLGTFTASAQAPEKPRPIDHSGMLGTAVRAGIGSIGGSTVNYVDPSMIPPGQAVDLCFNVTVTSPDFEYLDGFDADLPNNWTVHTVYDVAGNGCQLGHTYGVNAGNVLYWYTNGMPTGCGDWVPGTYDFCANVTVPDCTGAPWSLEWNIWGDTYGEAPHSVAGATAAGCLQAGVYLTPGTQSGEACVGDSVTYTLNLLNNTGLDATFGVGRTAVWDTACPATVYALSGETVPFDCSVTVACGGGTDTATVTVTGGKAKYSASATLVTSSSAIGNWIDEPSSPLPVMDHAAVSYNGKLYVVGGYGSGGAVQIWDGVAWTQGAANGIDDYSNDACLGLDAAGNPVIDLMGDTTSLLNIERYSIDANTWTALPYPAGYPGLWAPDIVSMLQHTGENVCYISGGATTPGGGNTNALYRYDPALQTMVNLGNYTYSATGIAFHFSWWVPWVEGGAICAAGGVDANSVAYAGSQCYYLATGTFGPVDADLGPLPQPWWGGADGWKTDEEGLYEIWGYNGVDAAFALLQQSFVSSGAGFVYGPAPLYGEYRLEGDGLAGSVWAANGSTGGFTLSTSQEWLLQCGPCVQCRTHLFRTKLNWSYASRLGWVKTLFAGIVHDQDHVRIGGATVSGFWTINGVAQPGATYVTTPAGQFKFPWKGAWAQPGEYLFQVTGIQYGTCSYDPVANENPGGRSVTVPPPPE